jgi:MTH538 TIR-like domain (DUF1863)
MRILMARRCLYIFHYEPINWRALNVRQIDAIEGDQSATDNDWESDTSEIHSEEKIKRRLATKVKDHTFTIIPGGTGTAKHNWLNHEVTKS